MKIKGILTTLNILLSITNICSQFAPDINNAYHFTPQNVGFATPQTAEFVKYSNININHYNGLLDFEVPLYEYKDRDFEIPISLKYISEGFKPSKRPSLVGYNWMLNVGGVITREVAGSPDDTEGFYIKHQYKYMPDGVLAMKGKPYDKYYSNDELWGLQMPKTKNGNTYYYGDFERDFSLDIFHFNFGKHKGSFVIGNNGFPTLLTGKEYKIEISGIATQSYSTTDIPKASKILIYTPDGYKYEFGGDDSYLEYLIPGVEHLSSYYLIKEKPVYIISWYLKSITAPNGRIVTFSYTSTEQKNKYTYHVSNIVNVNTYVTCFTSSPAYDRSWSGPNKTDTATIKIKDKIFVPLLDKIKIDNTTIEFNRSKLNYPFHSTEAANDLWYLDLIELKHNSTLVKSIDFSYITEGRYFFLDELNLNEQHNNQEIYKFDYYLERILPDPQTISVDHWGFWNGGYSMSEKAQSYLTNINDRKSVSTSVFNIGLLKSIVYPTGGTSEIEYDYNRYHHRKVKDDQIIHLKDFFSETSIPCGGARVEKIKDYDPVAKKIMNERTFLYKKPNESNESGIIATLPSYKSSDEIQTKRSYSEMVSNYPDPPVWINCDEFVVATYGTMSSNTVGTENNISEYHIGYSDVIEEFNDGSFIHYHFSSLMDVPDDEDVRSYYLEPPTPNGSFVVSRTLSNAQLKNKFGLYKVNDMSKYRGKLLNKTTYSSTNNIVKEEIYTYNLEEAKNDYCISVTSLPAGQVANKIYTVPCRLIRQNITDANNVSEQIDYVYNAFDFVKSKEMTNSDGKKQATEFLYPSEIVQGADTATIRKMTNKNILSNYIEKVTYLGENKVIDAEYRKYNEVHPDLFLPERIDLLKKENITYDMLFSLNNFYIPVVRLSSGIFTPFPRMGAYIVRRVPEKVQIRATGKGSVEITCNGEVIYSRSFSQDYQEEINLIPGNYRVSLSFNLLYTPTFTILSKRTRRMAGNANLKPEIGYKYDKKGNIIEATPTGSELPTAYLWSYNYQYPIAKIENATYSDVCKAIGNNNEQTGKNTLETIAGKNEPAATDFTTLNNLRTLLPDAMVTTYTHKPLVGIKTVTNPSGKTINYEYDSFNRLQSIKDQSGKIIEQYDYHYQTP